MKALIVVEGKKTCSRCLEWLPIECFDKYQSSSSGLASWCKKCSKEYRAPRKEQQKIIAKRHYENNRGQYLARQRFRIYGLTDEAFQSMLKEQEGLCAICRGPEINMKRGRVMSLSIDHDHLTGRVRSLLCHHCNVGLGGFRDDPEKLLAAVDYLRKAAI